MELKFNDGALKSAISEAILSQIDEPSRNAMIQEALKHLTEVPKSSFGEKKGSSAIVNHFSRAVDNIARETISKMVESDEEIRSLVEETVRTTVTNFLKTKGDAFAETLATHVSESFNKTTY